MALITVVAADVAPVDVWEQFTLPVDEALTAGQYARLTTTGNMVLGNGTSTGEVGNVKGMALNGVAIGETTTFVKRGVVSLGTTALSAMAYGAPVYLSDTDGTFGDAAGTVSTIVGYVVPGNANTTPDKLLMLLL